MVREVICGPFHSSHRVQWTAKIREQVQAGQAQACLYFVPTRGLAGVVRESILQGLPGMAGEQVLTLFEGVEAVLAKSDRSYIRLDGLMTERLVAKVLRQMKGSWNGEPLEKWSHLPGVVAAFRQHIGELKRAQVDPAIMLPHVTGTANEETVTVLNAVYAEYQKELLQGAFPLLDTEETYLEAARVLEEKGLDAVFPGVDTVYVDYFTDFQPHQMKVLLPLLKVPNVQIYLPYQPKRWEWMDSMADLMRKTVDDSFAKAGLQVRYEDEEAVPEMQEDIRELQARFFAPNPPELLDAPNVQVFAARTAEKEWLWVAKQIKRLHREQGVALQDIAILTNRPFNYGSTGHRVMKREGIPVNQQVALTADEVPWILDLLALYTLAETDWHRDTLQRLTGVEWLLGQNPMEGRETALQPVAKQLGIVQGLTTWRERLQSALQNRLGKKQAEGADELPEDVQDLQAIAEWIELLAAKVEPLPAISDGAAHVQALRTLLPGNALYDRLVAKYRAGGGYTVAYLQRDLRALEALEQVLQAFERTEQLLGGETVYSRQEFVQLLAGRLQAEEIVIEREARAGVAYLEPSAARGLSFAHVFFVGLNEGEWPKSPSTPWLLREGLRAELAKKEVPLLAPDVQMDQQKLFFLMGLHTARKGVSVSFVSASKQDLPSRFVDQLYEVCPNLREKAEMEDEYLGGSQLYPAKPEDISNEQEARDWLAAKMATDVLSVEAMLLVEPKHWQQVLLQAKSELERAEVMEEPAIGSRFDGWLQDEAIHNRLAERFSQEAVYSVSQFNRYGECGYKYYLSYVLRLNNEEEEYEELSALERGNLYHRVLHRLYSNLTNEKKITAEKIEWLKTQLEPIFEAEWQKMQSGRYTAVGTRQLLEKERLLKKLRGFLEVEAEAWQTQGIDLVPRYLEWRFGMPFDGESDPHSQKEPIQVGTLKFRGQIDRIDATEAGEFFVVDYKSRSTKPMPRAIENGTDFQLPVYLKAVEQALFKEGRSVGASYFSIEKADRVSSALIQDDYRSAYGISERKNKVEDWNGLMTQMQETLEAYRLKMTRGEFPVWPSDRSKCDYCEYRQICRYQPMKALQQKRNQTAQEGGEANG